MKLAFILPDLSGGGAARVASILCNQWQQIGVDVHLATFEAAGTAGVYPVANGVARHQVGLSASPPTAVGFALNNLKRVHVLRRVLRRARPDCVVSFLLNANVSAVAAARSLGLPIIISERNHPALDRITGAKALLRRHAYPRASSLVVQTEDIRNWYQGHLGIDATVIPNPVEPGRATTCEAEQVLRSGHRRRIISLGRLEPQKGYDRLIDAFAQIASKAPDWDLTIFGEGGERRRLEGLVEERGLADRVTLPGTTRDTWRELELSDLYVHPARYEGYPNAVIEALAAGLCVVATDAPGATGEILQGGAKGILVDDAGPEAIADGLMRVINDDALRGAFARGARDAVAHLDPGIIAAVWLAEIERVTRGQPSRSRSSR